MKSLSILIRVLVICGAPTVFAQDAAPARSIVVNPDWLKKPTSEQVTAALPREALIKGKSGRALLSCGVNIQGLLESCEVAQEEPAGFRFGEAALTLTDQFQFRPSTRDGRPIPSRINIPIIFTLTGPSRSEDLQSIRLLSQPIWNSAPTFSEVGAAYPKAGGGMTGYVAHRCHVKSDGSLMYCNIIDENPTGRGFGGAAHGLLKSFSVKMSDDLLKSPEKVLVDIPIRLIDPKSEEFSSRRIGEPLWLTKIDPLRSSGLFPSQATKQGIRSGRGTAKCVVAPSGELVDCTPGVADPPDMGFSESAVRIVLVMRMNRWTAGGGPIDGATVVIPVRLQNPVASAAQHPPTP